MRYLLKRMALYIGAVCALSLTILTTDVSAQNKEGRGLLSGLFDKDDKPGEVEPYVPGIWVDPDGCEHWVMDDGFEGFMTPHVNRQGIPVCRRGTPCGTMETDQFFVSDSAKINPAGDARLEEFFTTVDAVSYIIVGHTDSRASDAYNLRLSYRRANAVAAIALRTGSRIADVRGYGERMPLASNGTAEGRAQNRRVEIICLR
jgi:outer membrane protein OmpA-like peptidoglycan-associated protein